MYSTTVTRTAFNAVTVEGTLTSLVCIATVLKVTSVTVTKGQVTRRERAALTLPILYQNKLEHSSESNTPRG
jgi:hypothetical protein